jgi:hypothetical protein
VIRDEIIRMAREAGASTKVKHITIVDGDGIVFTQDELERFAALVAAAEREAVLEEWDARLQGDLEHGVAWLNECVAAEWRNKYPDMAGFGKWLMQRKGE